MPDLIFHMEEVLTFYVRSGELKVEEATKGRLAVGTGFFKDPIPYDPETEEIWVIRRKKGR